MTDLDRSSLTSVLRALGDVLAARGYAYDLVMVGGAALLLRGTVSRPTKDGDIVGERRADGSIARLDRLPPELARAALDVARAYGLADDWLNLGPASLLDGPLPEGFEQRLNPAEFGGLRLWIAGREDLVALKLWATADRWPAPGATSRTCRPWPPPPSSSVAPPPGHASGTRRPGTGNSSLSSSGGST